jgi:hypothetical protein
MVDWLSIKKAADEEDLYKNLRSRFYKEWGLNEEEGRKYPDWPKLSLKERDELLRKLEGWIGWNDDNEPPEFGALLRRLHKMRDNAALAAYLPRKGTFDPDTVKDYHHLDAVLGQMSPKQLERIPLTDRMRAGSKKGYFGNYDYPDWLFERGEFGENARRAHLEKRINTVADLIKYRRWPDMANLPKAGRKRHIDWKVVDKSFDPYKDYDEKGALYRLKNGEYLYPSPYDEHELVYDNGVPFSNKQDYFAFNDKEGNPVYRERF